MSAYKRIFFTALYLTSCSSIAAAPDPEKIFPDKAASENSILPENYVFLAKEKTDFNKDGIPDLVFIAEHKDFTREKALDNPEAETPRLLGIYFGFRDTQKKSGFRKVLIHSKAVYGPLDGGIFGDPFESLTVKNNTFKISFYGGSAWRWGHSWQFRWQDGGFYLIGHTNYSHHTLSEVSEKNDYNLSTGIMIKESTDENGRRRSETVRRGKKKLLRLEDFDIFSEKNNF